MKKLLVVGSDYGTVEIVKEAKRMGLYVIVADYKNTTPTKQLADETWLVSTVDIDTLERKSREEEIDAVIAGASDFNLGNLRQLCKRLNLPVYCENDRAWEVATNKYEFKKLCKALGAPIAEDYDLDDSLQRDDLDKIHYPVVVKPVDKSGNRGMSYCADESELLTAYQYARSVSDNSRIIVERELHGPEFAVNYVIADGEPKLLFISSEHNQPGEPDNLYSVIITTSAYLDKYKREVDERVKSVFREAGCTEGVAWVECMLDSDGHFYLLEMGYRFGGEVVNIPYEGVCGFNSVKWMIDIALGKKHMKEELPSDLIPEYKCACAYMLFSDRNGTIEMISGLEEIAALEGVSVDIPKLAGDEVRYHATIGVIRIFSVDCDGICEKVKMVNSYLQILDEHGENMYVRYDNFEELKKEYFFGLNSGENA